MCDIESRFFRRWYSRPAHISLLTLLNFIYAKNSRTKRVSQFWIRHGPVIPFGPRQTKSARREVSCCCRRRKAVRRLLRVLLGDNLSAFRNCLIAKWFGRTSVCWRAAWRGAEFWLLKQRHWYIIAAHSVATLLSDRRTAVAAVRRYSRQLGGL